MKILASAPDWEIVDDDADGLGSFIYKRPRKEAPLALALVPPPQQQAEAEEADADEIETEQELLQRKREILLQRKQVYAAELKKWEELFSKQEEVIAAVEPASLPPPNLDTAANDEGDAHYEPYEELLDQVQDLEWLIRKHTNFCEQAEEMCRILDEEVKYDTLELPSPRHIFESLMLPAVQTL